jgi:RNA 3'-terminal phosphate cyclase
MDNLDPPTIIAIGQAAAAILRALGKALAVVAARRGHAPIADVGGPPER